MICQMPPFWWMVIYQPGSARELVSRQRWPRCRVSYPVAVHKMLFAHFNCETPAPFPGHPFVCDTASLSSVCCGGRREDASPLPFAPPPGSILLLLRLFHLSPPALLCVFIVTSKWPSPPCSLQNPHPSFFSQDQWETQRRGKLTAHYFPDSSIIPVMLSTFPWTIGIQVRKKKPTTTKKNFHADVTTNLFHAWHKSCCWGQKKWEESTSDCICEWKFTYLSACVYRSVYSSEPPPWHVGRGEVCAFPPHSIMAGVSAALGGDDNNNNNNKKNKKTRGHSPRLVYRAGPFYRSGPPKGRSAPDKKRGEKTLEDECMVMRGSERERESLVGWGR